MSFSLASYVHMGNAWFRNTALHPFIHSPENYYGFLSSPDPLVPSPTQIVSAALIFRAAIKQACQSKVVAFPEALDLCTLQAETQTHSWQTQQATFHDPDLIMQSYIDLFWFTIGSHVYRNWTWQPIFSSACKLRITKYRSVHIRDDNANCKL